MKRQSISIVLLATILLQSCVAYQKTSVSLNEAANNNKQVRVYNNLGERFVYAKINLKDGVYYGAKGGKEVPLYPAQLSGIYLKDKKKSTRGTIIAIASYFIIPTILFLLFPPEFEF